VTRGEERRGDESRGDERRGEVTREAASQRELVNRMLGDALQPIADTVRHRMHSQGASAIECQCVEAACCRSSTHPVAGCPLSLAAAAVSIRISHTISLRHLSIPVSA
jgi:hypothetical protein